MFSSKKKTEAALARLHACAEECDCRLELVNGETGETMVPDHDAIKAGFIAGIVAARAIVRNDEAASKEPKLQMLAGMNTAGKVYLRERLGRLQEEADGVDNG